MVVGLCFGGCQSPGLIEVSRGADPDALISVVDCLNTALGIIGPGGVKEVCKDGFLIVVRDNPREEGKFTHRPWGPWEIEIPNGALSTHPLTHELAHVAMRSPRDFPDSKLWIDEGVCEYVSYQGSDAVDDLLDLLGALSSDGPLTVTSTKYVHSKVRLTNGYSFPTVPLGGSYGALRSNWHRFANDPLSEIDFAVVLEEDSHCAGPMLYFRAFLEVAWLLESEERSPAQTSPLALALLVENRVANSAPPSVSAIEDYGQHLLLDILDFKEWGRLRDEVESAGVAVEEAEDIYRIVSIEVLDYEGPRIRYSGTAPTYRTRWAQRILGQLGSNPPGTWQAAHGED